jgi:hypothetical protein
LGGRGRRISELETQVYRGQAGLQSEFRTTRTTQRNLVLKKKKKKRKKERKRGNPNLKNVKTQYQPNDIHPVRTLIVFALH